MYKVMKSHWREENLYASYPKAEIRFVAASLSLFLSLICLGTYLCIIDYQFIISIAQVFLCWSS